MGEREIEFFPTGPIISGEPIQFDIPESTTQMTDPSFLLKITCKIVEGDGSDLKADARVGPVNLTLHALFYDVVLKANNTIITQSTGTYAYRAYFETVYTYSSAAKNGAIGIPQLYYKDKGGKFNGVLADINPGFDQRMKKFEKSAEVEMAGRLHCDLLLQNKMIIPGVKFTVILFPSTTAFHMLSSTNNPAEKLVITRLTMKIKRVNWSIEKSLQNKTVNYPVNHAVVRTAQLSTGQTHLSNYIIHNGQIPKLIIFTLVPTYNFTGQYTSNPFLFTLRDCSFAQIEVNGRQYPPLAYTPNKSMIEPYLNSLRMVEKLFADTDTGITFDDFQESGYEILPFDLSAEGQKNGVVTFSAQWPMLKVDSFYTILFYILWENNISIDPNKNVTLDFIP